MSETTTRTGTTGGLARPLEGQVALVTAAGGAGIGRAIALALAGRGATVAVTDRNADRAMAVVAEIEAAGGSAQRWELDVSRRDQVDAVVGAVVETFGQVDILVNNAGISLASPVATMTDEAWDTVMAVNLRGTFLVTRAVLPGMMARRHGRIVNLASYVAFAGAEELAHYAASKAGIVAFTKSLALEVGRHGITVNALAPGVIFNEHLRRSRAQLPPAIGELAARGTPLGRDGEPGDVAGAALFLVSEEGRFVTGAVIPVTGGLYMP